MSLLFALPGVAHSAYGPRLYVDIHPPGWFSSKAVCVNARGQTAGNGMTPQGERGFLWSAGQHAILLPPGARSSRVSWVNDRGDVAGTAFDAEGTPHAFLFRNGEYADPAPGWRSSEALFVGKDGVVTGTGELGGFVSGGGTVSTPPSFSSIVGRTSAGVLFGTGDNVARMFIPDKGYLSLLPPGGETASPGRMNENGLATFSAPDQGVEKGYVFSGGFMIFMTPPGWTSSVAESINILGEVAGFGDGPQGRRGFLRSGIDYEVISCPECVSTQAESINDFGEVAGSGETVSGETHAFFSYPASVSITAMEPSSTGGISGGGGCSTVSRAGEPVSASGVANFLSLLCPMGFLLARRRMRRGLTPR
jgi:probable HAF family extracellular repeat protein